MLWAYLKWFLISGWSPAMNGQWAHCNKRLGITLLTLKGFSYEGYMKNYWIIYVNMYRKIRFTTACFVTLLTTVFKFFKSFTFVYRKISFSRACIIGLFTATLFKSQTHMYCKIRFTRVCLITFFTSTYFKSLKFKTEQNKVRMHNVK